MPMLKELLGTVTFFSRRLDDDIVDRFNYFFTTNILVVLSVLVSFKQFGGKPMECMVPDGFPGGWEQYAENYCWAQDTYFLPFSKFEVPKREALRYRQKICYYQWVPFFLLIEAACFYIPSVFWKLLSGHSGIKVDDIVRMATEQNNIKPNIRKNTIKILTVHLENALKFYRRLERRHFTPHKYVRFLNLPYSSCYVTAVYMMTKCLYLINALLQWVLMNRFLGTGESYSLYGYDALRDLINGSTWQTSGVFPRVTLCDFQVRAMGSNVQNYTIQCVLVINLFNEKIFVFLWFWYLILAALTLFSFLYWGTMMTIPVFSRWFVTRHLELCEMPFDIKESRRDVYKFVHSYVRTDGAFVIRMVTMHTGVIFTTDLVLSLWRSFFNIEEECKRQPSGDTPVTGDVEKGTLNLSTVRFRPGKGDKKDPDDQKEVLVSPEHLYNNERDLVDGSKKPPKPLKKVSESFPLPPKEDLWDEGDETADEDDVVDQNWKTPLAPPPPPPMPQPQHPRKMNV